MSDARPPGKIITFYSYKGGTGRTMALANVAWILASNGKRVLVIDWDLEAPGLHRYLHPFLEDKEGTDTPGLIDYFVDIEMASRREPPSADTPWWHEWCSLSRYTVSLDWEFSDGGFLDFVSAGQQGPTYAERVSAFDWRKFYDALGGGVLLESLKSRLRDEYDYVLIDSRTGISDTSGICTVQLPDELVVCFTLNQQSMKGAAAAAHSAWNQRMKPNGEPGLKIWPVPTRIELAEQERLDAARESARSMFEWFIGHLGRSLRETYWSNTEVMYQPFFAYEEILAAFAERRSGAGSMILTMGMLAQRLSDVDIRLPKLEESIRLKIYRQFVSDSSADPNVDAGPLTYLSYSTAYESAARAIAKDLKSHGVRVYLDVDEVDFGEDINDVAKAGLARASTVLALFGEKPGRSSQTHELVSARDAGKRVIPAIVGQGTFDDVPEEFRRYRGVDLRIPTYDASVATLATALKVGPSERSHPNNPDDPQKGRWGGKPAANGRVLTATVTELSPSWYQLELIVESSFGARILEGEVEFHLHPTFPSSTLRRSAIGGRATLSIGAWGAFTVGAVCDNGATTLELDLAQVPAFPQAFRER